jgi:cyclohexadienyl dehydratase
VGADHLENPHARHAGRPLRHRHGRDFGDPGTTEKSLFQQHPRRRRQIPLVRCADQDKYQSIAQINQPGVRLVEPAGGTNEAFVHAFLPKAQLALHDNVTIFQQLLDNKADVMITDASEALYQQKLKPGLCAVNPQQFMQYGEKAYLLPRDDNSWKLYVDQWLHLSKVTGQYQKVLGEWLALPQ